MLKRYHERVTSYFRGTIIDIESCGNFCRQFADSREYKDIIPTIFGRINCYELTILCALGKAALAELKLEMGKLVPALERPLFAFHCDFEQGVIYHSCSIKMIFDGDLNKEEFESKRQAVKTLRIPNYDDPFNDDGAKCMDSWLTGDYEGSIMHNRSCLLKERDILITRSHRKPEELKFF